MPRWKIFALLGGVGLLVVLYAVFSAVNTVPPSSEAPPEPPSSGAPPEPPSSEAPPDVGSPGEQTEANQYQYPAEGGGEDEQPLTPLQRVDLALERLEESNIAFNAPSQMRLGEATTIELRLSPSAEVQELTAQLRESGAVGQIESAEHIATSAVMQARLTGQDFKIEARSDERQAVSREDPTIWRWDIEPTEPGEKRLHLTLSALVKVEGESASRQIESFDRTIPVTVPLGQRLSGFVGNNWQWLWTVFLVPVALWVWRTWRNRRREEEPPFMRPPS